jgi:hypothetical protein
MFFSTTVHALMPQFRHSEYYYEQRLTGLRRVNFPTIGRILAAFRDDEQVVAPETIKSHLKNIYQKLDVGKRREAISKAMDLGILTHRRSE